MRKQLHFHFLKDIHEALAIAGLGNVSLPNNLGAGQHDEISIMTN